MSLNSVKKVALAASLLAAVACGKNKNNLNIDGTYEIEKMSFTDSTSKETIDQPQKLNAVEIKDNVLAMYNFSDDKKAVQITKVKFDVTGKKLSGGSLAEENPCADDQEATKITGSLHKTKGHLVISIDDADGRSELVLKNIDKEKFDELTKDLKAGKLEKACIVDGKVQRKLGKILSASPTAQSVGQSTDQVSDQSASQVDNTSLAQVSENKTGAPKAAGDKILEAISSKEESAMDEASLKNQSNGSGEKEQSDLVSEEK